MAHQEEKVYTKSMIDAFMKKRKTTKDYGDRRFLREFFNYPEELLKYDDGELPPSLRLIDAEMLQKEFKPSYFG